MQAPLHLASLQAVPPLAPLKPPLALASLQAILPLASLQTIFPVVLFSSIGLFVLVGVLSMVTRRNLHDQIGQGGLFVGEDYSGAGGYDSLAGAEGWGEELQAGAAREGGLDSQAERELEIRQMLTARSDRLVRQGHAPLDIDAELARLDWVDPRAGGSGAAEGSGDAALAEEVRQLVRARNERRQRQGLDTLDVEAEVQRTLAELSP
jgi:hypothetical protein